MRWCLAYRRTPQPYKPKQVRAFWRGLPESTQVLTVTPYTHDKWPWQGANDRRENRSVNLHRFLQRKYWPSRFITELASYTSMFQFWVRINCCLLCFSNHCNLSSLRLWLPPESFSGGKTNVAPSKSVYHNPLLFESILAFCRHDIWPCNDQPSRTSGHSWGIPFPPLITFWNTHRCLGIQ